jgi:hypothetical protein
MFGKDNYSSLESCERFLCHLEPRFSAEHHCRNARQPCDLLVPGSSSSSRHQRLDRQSRGEQGDQGDF